MARLQENIEKLKAQGSEDDSEEKVEWSKQCTYRIPQSAKL